MARCEKCGNAAVVDIVFATSGGLVAVPYVLRKKIFYKGSPVRGTACTACGAIALRLEKPEVLLPFVDYAAQGRGGGA